MVPYLKSSFNKNEDMEELIGVYGFDKNSLEIGAFYNANDTLYESTLMVELSDENNNVTIPVCTNKLSKEIKDHGEDSRLSKKFSKEFKDLLNEYIQEKSV